ncbi:MAG: SusC/RagA family TonB-linked outer membrane protein [Bacteroidota bacterium]
MNVKLRKFTIRMSKLGIYVMIMCQSIVMALATNSAAQRKYLEEIIVELSQSEQERSLIDVFKEIEENTTFRFAYSKSELKKYDIFLAGGNWQMDKLLANLSIQAKVSFKRVNESIGVYSVGETRILPEVSEQVTVQSSVSGKITDENGEALPGASIIVSGTSSGTTTDIDGNYSLECPDDAILIFSFVGYESQEIAVNNRSILDITLSPDLEQLEEVVVVGYGQVEMKDITGSVAQVKTKELEAVPVYNVEQALKARVAGVQVTQNSGQPGGRIEVRIRGGNSMIGSNDPLYVVDGFPITGGIGFLNPSDIESIDILKDASATAIYGARGANGVVIITSKRGAKSEKGKIEVNSYYGVQSETKRFDLLDSREYAVIANEWLLNSANPTPYFDLDNFNYPNTDWQDVIFQKAPIQNHTISFTGSSTKTRYALSGNYYGQEGIIISSGVKRGSLRLNLDHEVNNWLNLAVNLNLSRRQNISVPVNNGNRGSGSVLSAAASAPPTLPVYDADGLPTQIEQFYSFGSADMRNPLIFASQQSTTLANSVIGNTSFSISLTKDLTFKSLVGLEYENALSDQFNPIIFSNDRGYGRQRYGYTNSFLNENTLNYSKTFASIHKLDVVAGYTYQNYMSRFLEMTATGFANNTTQNYDLSAAENLGNPNSGISRWVLASWLGRVNYSLFDKYLMTISVRSDGSSRFGAANKWAVFPSAALAWRISDEAFMQGLEFLSDMKIRTSYGITGNTALSPYQSLDRLEAVRVVYANQTEEVGFVPNGIANSDLKWETTAQLDFGMDIGLLDNRFRITADYYKKNTSDLLASVPLPPSVGFGSILQNIGEIENRGIELTIGADIISNANFRWDITTSFSANKNEVIELAGGSDILGNGQAAVWSNTNIARVGEPLGSLFGYLERELDANGYIQYVDTNDDGVVNALDKVIVGNPYPDFFYGINTNLSYKNFEFNLFLDGVYGNEIFNATQGTHLNSFQRGNNQFTAILGNYWTQENPDPNAKYPRISSLTGIDISDRFIEDGSYLRVKSIRLAYNFPLKEWGLEAIDNAQLFVSGTNLFTFTKYTGLDPEMNTRGTDSQSIGSRLQMGHDQSGYPNAKNITVGLRLSL